MERTHLEAHGLPARGAAASRAPGAALALAGLALLAAGGARALTSAQTVGFDAEDQSIWGPGSAIVISDTHRLTATWNESLDFGDFETDPVFGGRYGAGGTANTSGEIGVELAYSIDSGSFDTSLPFASILSFDESSIADLQFFEVSHDAGLSSAAAFTTNFPEIQAYLDFILTTTNSVSAALCAGTCTAGNLDLGTLDLGFEIAQYNRSDNTGNGGTEPAPFDGTAAGTGSGEFVLLEGIPLVGIAKNAKRKKVKKTEKTTDEDGNEVEEEKPVEEEQQIALGDFVSARFKFPDIDTSASLAEAGTEANLRSTGQDDFLGIAIDVDAVVTQATGGIPTGLGFSETIKDVVDVSGDLVDVQLVPNIDVRQDFEVAPTLSTDLAFTNLDGSPQQVIVRRNGIVSTVNQVSGLTEDESFEINWGTRGQGGTILATPTYHLDADLTNTTSLVLGFDIELAALQLSADFGVDSIGVGPVFERTFSNLDLGIPGVALPVFDTTFAIGGLADITGQTLAIDQFGTGTLAETFTNQTLTTLKTLDPGRSLFNGTNTVRWVGNPAGLVIPTDSVLTNEGTLRIESAADSRFNPFLNVSGELDNGDSLEVRTVARILTGGRIASSGDFVIGDLDVFEGGNVTLSGGEFGGATSSTLGEVDVAAGGSLATEGDDLLKLGNLELRGAGTMALGNTDTEITGRVDSYGDLHLLEGGVLSFNGSPGTRLNVYGHFTNEGRIEAPSIIVHDGGVFATTGTVDIDSGLFAVVSGGLLTISGPEFGGRMGIRTLEVGGTVRTAGNDPLLLHSLRVRGGGSMILANGSTTIDGIVEARTNTTLDASGSVTVTSGDLLRVYRRFTNLGRLNTPGTVFVEAGGSFESLGTTDLSGGVLDVKDFGMLALGSGDFGGSAARGTLRLGGSYAFALATGHEKLRLINLDITGPGTLSLNHSDVQIITNVANHSNMSVDSGRTTVTGTLDNYRYLTVNAELLVANSVVVKGGGDLSSTGWLRLDGGTLRVDGGGRLDIAGGILGGLSGSGTLELLASSAARADGTNALRIQNVDLIGAGMFAIANGSTSVGGGVTNASHISIESTGSVEVTGGLTNDGLVTNSGRVTVTGFINGGGIYTQNAGSTVVEGRLTAGAVNILGGSLTGPGTVISDLLIGSGGSVGPGMSPGELLVLGDFTLAGLYDIEIGGRVPEAEHDVIRVDGIATLAAGALIEVSLVDLLDPFGNANPFDPLIGDFFDVITAFDIVGDLFGVSFAFPGFIDGDRYFRASVVGLASGEALRLTVRSRSAVPEPATALLCALGFALLQLGRRRGTGVA